MKIGAPSLVTAVLASGSLACRPPASPPVEQAPELSDWEQREAAEEQYYGATLAQVARDRERCEATRPAIDEAPVVALPGQDLPLAQPGWPKALPEPANLHGARHQLLADGSLAVDFEYPREAGRFDPQPLLDHLDAAGFELEGAYTFAFEYVLDDPSIRELRVYRFQGAAATLFVDHLGWSDGAVPRYTGGGCGGLVWDIYAWRDDCAHYLGTVGAPPKPDKSLQNHPEVEPTPLIFPRMRASFDDMEIMLEYDGVRYRMVDGYHDPPRCYLSSGDHVHCIDYEQCEGVELIAEKLDQPLP